MATTSSSRPSRRTPRASGGPSRDGRRASGARTRPDPRRHGREEARAPRDARSARHGFDRRLGERDEVGGRPLGAGEARSTSSGGSATVWKTVSTAGTTSAAGTAGSSIPSRFSAKSDSKAARSTRRRIDRTLQASRTVMTPASQWRTRSSRTRRAKGASCCGRTPGVGPRDSFEWKRTGPLRGKRRSMSVTSPRASHVTRSAPPSPSRESSTFRRKSGFLCQGN